MPARIYQRPKSTMQSGQGRAKHWVLEYDPAEAKRADPLTGWAGSSDTQEQVKLSFESAAEAADYALREGIEARVIPAPERKLKLQAYADNFK